MPSPPLIEIDELLAPIPGDSPAGGPVPFAVSKKLEDSRKEVRRSDFAEDDPRRPEMDQKPEWGVVTHLARETLVHSSKDLLVAARLVEALTREPRKPPAEALAQKPGIPPANGYGGLRDGLRLMRRLVSECWDRLQPPIESEEDKEVRAAPFNWLDGADTGAR